MSAKRLWEQDGPTATWLHSSDAFLSRDGRLDMRPSAFDPGYVRTRLLGLTPPLVEDVLTLNICHNA